MRLAGWGKSFAKTVLGNSFAKTVLGNSFAKIVLHQSGGWARRCLSNAGLERHLDLVAKGYLHHTDLCPSLDAKLQQAQKYKLLNLNQTL